LNQTRDGTNAGGWWNEALGQSTTPADTGGLDNHAYRLLVKPRTHSAQEAWWCQGQTGSEPPLIQMEELEIVEVEWLTPEQALAQEITGHLRE
jgi:hypothetical protein